MKSTHFTKEGFSQKEVFIKEIVGDKVQVLDSFGMPMLLPLRFLPGSRLPQPGEWWIVERGLGSVWTFQFHHVDARTAGVWTSWTPTFADLDAYTAPTNTTLTGRYRKDSVNRSVRGVLNCIWLTSGAGGSGTIAFSLPLPPNEQILGSSPLMAVGSATLTHAAGPTSATAALKSGVDPDGDPLTHLVLVAPGGYVNATTPWSWGTVGDAISIEFEFETT